MRRVMEVVNTDKKQVGWMIFCPGCDQGHQLDARWKFNGNVEKPTFGPVTPKSKHSLLVKTVEPFTEDEYKRVMAGERIPPRPVVCHSYITDGRIKFLGDCTHKLKGQTVDLPDWDEMNKKDG